MKRGVHSCKIDYDQTDMFDEGTDDAEENEKCMITQWHGNVFRPFLVCVCVWGGGGGG